MADLPVYDLDAEVAVLSACLLDFEGKTLATVRGVIKAPEEFYSGANAAIYQAICELDNAGKPRDIITVTSTLRGLNKLSSVGGIDYLNEITDKSPNVANVNDHAKIVADCASQRRMVVILRQCLSSGSVRQPDATKWRQTIAEKILSCAQDTDIEYDPGDAASIVETMRTYSKAPSSHLVSTGYPSIDEYYYGGLRRKKETVIAGNPGDCKTAVAGNIAFNVAQSGLGSIFVTLEMTKEELMQRIISYHSGIPFELLELKQFLDDKNMNKTYQDSLDYISQLPLAIVEASGPTASEIRTLVRREHLNLEARLNKKVNLSLVTVDYLQLMNYEGSSDLGAKALGNMNKQLIWFAREANFAFIGLSQLKRVDTGGANVRNKPDPRPQANQLRYSGDIEADAYSIIMPYRADKNLPPHEQTGDAELLIRKNRNGRMGTVHMRFDGPCISFREI